MKRLLLILTPCIVCAAEIRHDDHHVRNAPRVAVRVAQRPEFIFENIKVAGVDVRGLKASVVKNLREYSKTVREFRETFDVEKMLAEIPRIRHVAHSTAVSIDDRMQARKEMEILLAAYNDPDFQRVLTIRNAKNFENAKNALRELEYQYRNNNISAIQMGIAEQYYMQRPEVKEFSRRIAESCDLVTTSQLPIRERLKLDERLFQMGYRKPVENHKELNWFEVDKYIKAHMALTARMVLETEELTWDEWSAIHMQMIQEFIHNSFDYAYGVGIGYPQGVGQPFKPLKDFADKLLNVVTDSMEMIFGEHKAKHDMIKSYRKWYRETRPQRSIDYRKEGEKIGMHLGKLSVVWAKAPSKGAQEILATTKKLSATAGIFQNIPCVII